jgi:hypothetical protein
LQFGTVLSLTVEEAKNLQQSQELVQGKSWTVI